MNILVNGLKSKTGGGKSYLTNYLTLLQKSGSPHKYFVLTPDRTAYARYAAPHLEIVDIPAPFKRNALFLFLYRVVMPWILRRYRIDRIFNLGDIPIPTRLPQLYLFDWAYAAYPRGSIWGRQKFPSSWVRRIKLHWFQRYIRFPTRIAAQTETMRKCLEKEYGLRNVQVIPNAVALDNLAHGNPKDFGLPADKFKFVYLSHYYSHKNIEIFLPLAHAIRREGFPALLVTTIAAEQDPAAAAFLATVASEKLDDVIRNVGPVAMPHLPSLYAQCDALLMPTLLESFSGTYVEAMFHGLPILTSQREFAVDVCRDAALYFDPLDPEAILTTIRSLMNDATLRTRQVAAGKARLADFLSWEQVYEKFRAALEADA